MSSELEKYIYDKLNAMQSAKENAKVVPAFVTKADFFSSVDKDIRKVMNKLFLENKLKVHPTKDAPIQDFIELTKEN